MTTTTRTPTFDGSSLILDGLPGFFTLHYQPEFDLATHRVVGCESLLRWWHPDFGMLRPGATVERLVPALVDALVGMLDAPDTTRTEPAPAHRRGGTP